MNNALHSLYTHVYKKHCATTMKAETTALRPNRGDDYEFAEFLTPICVMAGMTDSANLNLDPFSVTLEKNIKAHVAHLQSLRALQSDLEAAMAMNPTLHHLIAGELERCGTLFRPKNSTSSGMYVYDDPGHMEEDGKRLQEVLEEVVGRDAAEGCSAATD